MNSSTRTESGSGRLPSITNLRATVYDAVSTSIAKVDKMIVLGINEEVNAVVPEEGDIVGGVINRGRPADGVEALLLYRRAVAMICTVTCMLLPSAPFLSAKSAKGDISE